MRLPSSGHINSPTVGLHRLSKHFPRRWRNTSASSLKFYWQKFRGGSSSVIHLLTPICAQLPSLTRGSLLFLTGFLWLLLSTDENISVCCDDELIAVKLPTSRLPETNPTPYMCFCSPEIRGDSRSSHFSSPRAPSLLCRWKHTEIQEGILLPLSYATGYPWPAAKYNGTGTQDV